MFSGYFYVSYLFVDVLCNRISSLPSSEEAGIAKEKENAMVKGKGTHIQCIYNSGIYKLYCSKICESIVGRNNFLFDLLQRLTGFVMQVITYVLLKDDKMIEKVAFQTNCKNTNYMVKYILSRRVTIKKECVVQTQNFNE